MTLSLNTLKFEFRPLLGDDLTTLHKWLNKKHVSINWDGPLSIKEVIDKYSKNIESNFVFPYIVYMDNKKIGFIQSYVAKRIGSGWWKNEPEGTWGVDQFIGDEKILGQGIGSTFLNKFCLELLTNQNVKRIITDPNPINLSAIKCYEKAGFKKIKTITAPDGPATLMEFDP